MPKESRKCHPNGTNWREKFQESEAFRWKAQQEKKSLQAEVERLKDENISMQTQIFILAAFKEAHSKEFYSRRFKMKAEEEIQQLREEVVKLGQERSTSPERLPDINYLKRYFSQMRRDDKDKYLNTLTALFSNND
jgi:predicted RNase H-like nuclease (RuvC/YqgF family)